MTSRSPDRSDAPASGAWVYTLHGNCYLNLTNQCTLRCGFCPKFNKTWDVQGYDLRIDGEPSAEELFAAIGDPSRFKEVVFCGLGEPMLRLDVLLVTAEGVKARGARRVRVNTDGLANLVHGRDITPSLFGRIDALSVSLNAQNEEVYNRNCRPLLPGAYDAVLQFVRRVRLFVPDVTVTAIDGLAGVDIDACQQRARELGVSFRRRVLDEVG
ncbi:MAG: TatD family nuclease-associated radical SAM protein [Gammaproteobacteria bacterium]